MLGAQVHAGVSPALVATGATARRKQAMARDNVGLLARARMRVHVMHIFLVYFFCLSPS